ncbi:CBS domain-containing protein [bacterium]|nr:CBS domain-containing protein [bacterium]
MIDYNEHLDDEQQQMDEASSSSHGKVRETIHLDDLITTIKLRKPVTVTGTTSVAQSLEIMRDEKIGCLLITESDKLIGIFTERDIIRRIVGKNLSHADVDVGDYMTVDPDTLSPDSPLAFALNYMVVGGYRHVPIVDDENRIIACLSIKDIVKHIGNHYFSEISNLPPVPKNPGWATVDGG